MWNHVPSESITENDSGYIHKGRNKFYEEIESIGLVQKGVYNGYDTYIFDKSLIK